MENSLEFKYILYLTMNIVNGKFYIGVHKTDTPYKFDGYLGCGATLDKPSSYNKGKTPLHAAILKHGTHSFKRVTLMVFDTMEEALQMEASIVTKEFIKLSNNYNATVGGGLPPLLNIPINQFDLEGNFIKTWESEAEVRKHFNSRASFNDIIKDKRNFAGYYWSRDFKIDVTEYKRVINHSYIEQYDKDGNYITSYPSVNFASQKLDISFQKLNMAVFRMKLCEGYYFIKSGMSIYNILNKSNNRTANRHPIYRYKLTGEYDRYFKTTVEAVRATPHANGSSIKNAVCNGWLTGGYRWSYFKSDNYFNLEAPCKYDPVPLIEQFDKEGNLIKVWSNFKDCKKQFPYCLDVCRGKLKSTRGYVFKYQTKDIV